MELVSTRTPGHRVGFAEAVRRGLAPDGGLYIPERIPRLPEVCLDPGLPFQVRSVLVLLEWLKAVFTPEEIAAIVHEALTFDVPLVPFPDEAGRRRFILELFHGPTLSFKDVGARTLAAFMKRDPEGPGQTIFAATSGDTGSAVADAFSRTGAFQVVLLFPAGGVSPLQQLQLTVERPGVYAFAVNGSFDDCQRLVKDAFQDPTLQKLRPGSANSINIGRLLPQMLYYVHAASVLDEGLVDVCVPSGNLGNITSAWMARASGAALGRLIAAHNANHPFADFLESGVYTAAPTRATASNAMDVGNPSNFERLRALLSDTGFHDVFSAGFATDEETLEAMRRAAADGYTADPHTAVGLSVSARHPYTGRPLVIASTAHPAKFPDISVAAGLPPVIEPSLEALRSAPHRVWNAPADPGGFKRILFDVWKPL